ncbi:MAG: hypothetical protein GX638_09490 [Crenarchaeota archaeon]|nr:hypothetical protein [Thermoproteota archaeon]
MSSQTYDAGDLGYITNANTGQLYNMYIKYSTGPGWQSWWDYTYYGSFSTDYSTLVRTGNQVSVVVESNDFTSSHFSGFSTDIGGSYVGYPFMRCSLPIQWQLETSSIWRLCTSWIYILRRNLYERLFNWKPSTPKHMELFEYRTN